jgi:predicted aspartyl protease
MGKIVQKFVFLGDKGKVVIEALLDSGASASVVRRDAAERLTGSFLRLPPRTLQMLNGKKWVSVADATLLGVKMKNKVLEGSFCVVDAMPREAIIGVDFMQKWEIRLDPKNHDFTIGLDPDAIEMARIPAPDGRGNSRSRLRRRTGCPAGRPC